MMLRLFFVAVLAFNPEILIIKAAANQQQLYAPVSALNEYGNLKQLQNAQEAATQHGMPIVAATAKDGVVVVASLSTRKEAGIIAEPTLLHRISLKESQSIGVACSGVKADSKWLIQTIRDYQKKNWERYGLENLSTKRLQYVISHALLNCMDYDRKKELHDGLLDLSNEDRWSRPLGVSVLVVSFANPITIVQPSGISEQYHAYAIGKYSKEMNDKLEERYQPNQHLKDVEMLLLDIMKELRKTTGGDDSSFIVMQVLTEGEISNYQI